MLTTTMWSEVRRPQFLDEVVGHREVKSRLQSYLTTKPHSNVILLHGSPGIGKTTMALASIRSCGMEPLEINATQSMRSHDDVSRLIASYRHTRSISSMIRGDNKASCLVLDEVDGSDSHAQRKLTEWFISAERILPILLTCNEVPRIFKACARIEILRCFPPSVSDLTPLFPKHDLQALAKTCQYDVRRMLHCLQYGQSEALPPPCPVFKQSPEVNEILRQKTWFATDPIVRALTSTANGTPVSR